MAKLNGVKTIDMVNGEITKVAYDEAEYAAVDGGQVTDTSDILQAKYSYCDRTEGAFYPVVAVRNGHVQWTENDGRSNGISADHVGERFNVFRKISAEQLPTIDERVSKLEAEVAELKVEGKTFKIGDYIVGLGGKYRVTNEWMTLGKVVGEIASCGDDIRIKVLTHKDESNNGVIFSVQSKYFRLATPAEVAAYEQAVKDAEKKAEQAKESAKWAKIGRKPGEFKLGDIVRVNSGLTGGHPTGTIGELVSGDCFASRREFGVLVDGKTRDHTASGFVLITPVDARFDK